MRAVASNSTGKAIHLRVHGKSVRRQTLEIEMLCHHSIPIPQASSSLGLSLPHTFLADGQQTSSSWLVGMYLACGCLRRVCGDGGLGVGHMNATSRQPPLWHRPLACADPTKLLSSSRGTPFVTLGSVSPLQHCSTTDHLLCQELPT